MLRVFKIFWTAEGTKPLIVLFCLLLAGISEAIGLTAILPILTQITGETAQGTGGQVGQNASVVNKFIHDWFAYIDIKPTIGLLISLVAIGMVVKSIFTFLAISYAGYSSAIVSTRLRSQLLAAIFKVHWKHYLGYKRGRIANVISNDATRSRQAYMFSAQFVAVSLQTMVYVVISIAISPKLALAGFVAGSILLLTLSRLVKIGRKAGFQQTDRTSELVTYMADALDNIKPVRAMNRSLHFEQFFNRQVNRLGKSMIKTVVAKTGLKHGQDALKIIAVCISLYLALVFLKTPLSELLVTGVVFFQMISILTKAQKFLQQASILESAYWRTLELTNELKAHRQENTGKLEPTLNTGCTFKDVSFSYTEIPVIQNASFTIPTGKITVLHGGSGAGKSTLIDLLLGLHQPSQGKILIDGVSLENINTNLWGDIIGYVPQELSLLHGTIRDNITLGDASITDTQVMDALIQAGSDGFVSQMPEGLDTIVGEMGSKLSGGQRQRIALARALVRKPKLLILDEVTSALDPATEERICANIADLAGQYTIVSITHRPAWTKIADHQYLVKQGKVTKAGNSVGKKAKKIISS